MLALLSLYLRLADAVYPSRGEGEDGCGREVTGRIGRKRSYRQWLRACGEIDLLRND